MDIGEHGGSKMKRILIVDDHPLLREGLEKVINAESGFEVIGKAGSVQDALSLVEEDAPDLVLTDLTLPGRSGLELIKDLKMSHPDLPVLVMSMHDELIYAERVLKAGGCGYIMKEAPPENLIQAIQTVLGGGVFASAAVTNHLLRSISSGRGKSKSSFPLERLTDRELEVFELIGHGKSNREIADQLGVSSRTIDTHRIHIREKFGLSDGTALTRYAVRWIEAGQLE